MEKSPDAMLAELQEVLADLKEAHERIQELTDAKAGDEVYDEIHAECDGPDPDALPPGARAPPQRALSPFTHTTPHPARAHHTTRRGSRHATSYAYHPLKRCGTSGSCCCSPSCGAWCGR